MLNNKILEKLKNSEQFKRSISEFVEKNAASISGVYGSFFSFFIYSFIQEFGDNCLVLAPDEETMEEVVDDLSVVCHDIDVLSFPAFKRDAWNEVGPNTAIVGEKIKTLKSLSCEKENQLIVTCPEALVEKIIFRDRLLDKKILIEKGVELNFDFFTRNVVKNGFVREERVDRPGEMSVRGGIVDIFLFEEVNPIRIEFFGDEIESVREFDVISQRTIAPIEKVEIIPPGSVGFFSPFEDHPKNSLFHEASLLDHLDSDTIIVTLDKDFLKEKLSVFENDMKERLGSFMLEHHLSDILYNDYYLAEGNLFDSIKEFRQLDINSLLLKKKSIFMSSTSCQQFGGNLKMFKNEIEKIVKSGGENQSIYFFSDSDAQKKRLQRVFEEEEFPDGIMLEEGNLSTGFAIPNQNLFVFTNRELYGKQKLKNVNKLESRPVSLKEFIDLKLGDYVVHTEFGVGIYRGLKRIKAYDKERECLSIEYKDRDNLYVPLEKMDLVQKYSSKEGAVPQLTKLGTNTWEKLKKRTKENAIDVAKKLVKLYAIRKMNKGFSFSQDTVWQRELEATFPFNETNDQILAIEDVKKDMEKQQPMDRLVCGDVGFGKTEVAIRASFKAINDNKQVGILVPTTILAQQHFTTFSDRLRQFPVKLEMLSRFRTPQQQKEILKKLAKGEIDLIIGTHRLLSKDIIFKDLGLLVVDEEQKFGVMHKEKLRLLREKVDTLSLSATPIPRTMHMSLMGAKDLSTINTPPVDRIPIKTEVCRFNRGHLREVILKEINRGGQVFFVHNRVQTIYGISTLLRDLVPEVSISIAHGQMSTQQLEKVMMSFTRGDVQCLVSTMIIESGIDMPRANTLIVNRADRLGLSQLYQLRGRVGRSDLQAYAYLIIPPLRNLTRTAVKRLQTIQELTHFGSGYKVAMRDLEIRGAGNIFGARQSGFVDALGYDLYAKIIQDAIAEMKTELNVDGAQAKHLPEAPEAKVEMYEDFYIPEDYVTLSTERVDIYRELVNVSDMLELQKLKTDIVDRFGPLPLPVKNLLNYIGIKKLAQKANIERMSLDQDKISGKFATSFIPKENEFRPWLEKLVKAGGEALELKQQGKDLLFVFNISENDNFINETTKFLQSIA